MTVLMLGALFVFVSTVSAAAKKGTVRVSGDNTWIVFVNGEEVAQGVDWQRPTVSEFDLSNGFAVVAIYVHDAEPGGAGSGGFLVDITLTALEFAKTQTA